MNNIAIKAPLDIVKSTLLQPDTVLRLNPSWYVKKTKETDNGFYNITLYDDRTEKASSTTINAEVCEKSVIYRSNSGRIEFSMDEITPAATKLFISGDFFREEDLPYWLKGLKNYIQLEAKQSRIIKGLLDRIWLRMTPSHRRITIMIIVAEGIGLIALIVVIIALKLIKT